MVEILGKIRLETKERFVDVESHINEKYTDYINNNTFIFEHGKIYGIVCEYGGGGEAISSLMSYQAIVKEEKIYIDEKEVKFSDIQDISWYVGKPLYSNGLIKKEVSIKKALEFAIKKYHRYEDIDDIIDEFHLTRGRLDYGVSNLSGERMRASLAIGYASNREVYCFPWMNTLFFYDLMLSSSVYRFFKKLRKEGSIIILPTSRRENISGFVDEIIEINSPRFDRILSDNEDFKKYF